jgi:integrase
MPREAIGTVAYVPADPKKGTTLGHYRYRITLGDGARPWIECPAGPRSPLVEQRVREKAVERSKEARAKGLRAEDFGLQPRAAAGRSHGGAPQSEAMSKWVEAWIASRRARGQTSTRENGSHYETHIAHALGDKHVRDWTAQDLRGLVRALDGKVQAGALKWKTASNVWATTLKMARDAGSSKLDVLRVRADNPAKDVVGPDRGARTAKQYLHPSEFQKFVACEQVPTRWRVATALAIFLFPRAGELRELRWEDVDLEHGTVHLHRARDRETGKTKSTKTGQARRFNIEPGALPLLEAMRAGHEAADYVADLPSERTLGRGLRRWLKRAGVNRPELHEDAPTRKAMTFHDLRATGITWMAVRGDDPLKIMQRAGHTSFSTTQGYIREAEAVREGFGDVFPPLPPSLLDAVRAGVGTGEDDDTSDGGTAIESSGNRPARSSRRASAHMAGGSSDAAEVPTSVLFADSAGSAFPVGVRVPSTPLCSTRRVEPWTNLSRVLDEGLVGIRTESRSSLRLARPSGTRHT